MTSMPGTARDRYGVLLSRLLGSGQWERALVTAGDWLAEEPQSATAHRAAAQAQINLERYKLATPHLRQVLAANPSDGFAWRLASVADFHQRRYDRAHENIRHALRLQPRDAWHWYHLATMRYAHGGRQAALQCAQRALEFAPNNADILNLLALCEPHGSPRRLARYQEALKFDPGNVVLHHNVGEYFLHTAKDHLRAAEAFHQVLALKPDHRIAQENLLVALRELDPVRRALRGPDRLWDRYNLLGESPGMRGALFKLLVMPWFGCIVLALYLPLTIFVLPLAGAYELLLKRELQVQIGIVGARRGGLLNFWRWPRRTRTGVLLVAYVAGWAGALALLARALHFFLR